MSAPRQIAVAKPLLGEREADAARRAIVSGWVSQGPEVAAFETEFAAFVGAPYACAVSNCTTALHLALLGVGVGPGDEVITVSHSFAATANAIRYCGAIPVFVDIGADGFNVDPSLIEPAVTPRTRAILCVHQLGMPCDLDQIVAIGRRLGLAVIEDAACAIGSEILWDGRWERIGRPHGDVACFSFHPRKVMTTGEGGMLTTSDPALDRKFRLWRQHAMGVSDAVRHASSSVIFETYSELGWNYRMTDIQAAVGREQLKRLPDIVAERRRLAERYDRALAAEGFRTPREPAWARTNWQSYCVGLPEGADQRSVMQWMLDAGVATRRGVMNIHLEPAYAGHDCWRAGSSLDRSLAAQHGSIILPLHAEVDDEAFDAIVGALIDACRRTSLKYAS